ncbi:SDR family oxidoreductase [Psychromonas algicola]|uniref:SDR family oxidoreductase n=1 Tax=Psychromonas algicola TaxID=2555642 RepID=UPI001067257C|nr:SDR family oxidoreductase [Psychromonas sp. RZ5]TEW52112.1 SDR family oxidoreductase [Psychromonas sp. RZ5]
MSLQKVALVTGGSRGIGASIVRQLAEDGFSVAINYASSASEAETLVTELKNKGIKVCAVKCNIANAEEVKLMFDHVEKTLGRINTLVNNAGIMKLAKLGDSDDDLFDSQVAINLKGTFNTLREAANRLCDGGRIVNLSTSVVGLKMETYGVYAATKAAVETLTAILSKELRGRSITVNAVAPGPTATDLFLNGKPPELIDRLAKMNPLERLGTPDDIARVVAFLASSNGGWINGQVLRANGGMV